MEERKELAQQVNEKSLGVLGRAARGWEPVLCTPIYVDIRIYIHEPKGGGGGGGGMGI